MSKSTGDRKSIKWKFIIVNTCIKKLERHETKDLIMHPKHLEKQEQTKSKVR